MQGPQRMNEVETQASLLCCGTLWGLWASIATGFPPLSQALITKALHLFFSRYSWHEVFINTVQLNEE